MEGRETKTLTIQKFVFEAKTYASALEANTIQQTLYAGAKIEVSGDQPKIADFNPGTIFEMQLEMIRQMVVSFDGSTENILERCKNLPSDVFDELVGALDELISKKKK